MFIQFTVCAHCILLNMLREYRNEPKFLDRQVWANSAGSSLFVIPFASFDKIP